jgi:hypothetical protein
VELTKTWYLFAPLVMPRRYRDPHAPDASRSDDLLRPNPGHREQDNRCAGRATKTALLVKNPHRRRD